MKRDGHCELEAADVGLSCDAKGTHVLTMGRFKWILCDDHHAPVRQTLNERLRWISEENAAGRDPRRPEFRRIMDERASALIRRSIRARGGEVAS